MWSGRSPVTKLQRISVLGCSSSFFIHCIDASAVHFRGFNQEKPMTYLVRRIPALVRAGAPGLLAVLAFLLSTAPTRASLTVVFQPSSVFAAPGSTGNVLELDLVTTSSFDLGGFNINIDVNSTDITFTGGDTNTTAPQGYILAGNSLGALVTNPPPPMAGDPQKIELNDFAANGDQVVGPGTYGLARFFFSVDPSTPLNDAFTVTIDPITTFADPSLNPITPVGTSATATINIGSVPEPSSLFLAGTGLLFAIGACSCRRDGAAAG
jgi:PEP-CTERM motif